jgi:hypothetical protein
MQNASLRMAWSRLAAVLRVQLEDVKSLLSEAFDELKKVELLDERDQARERAEENAREQAHACANAPAAASCDGAAATVLTAASTTIPTFRRRSLRTRSPYDVSILFGAGRHLGS